MDQHNKIAVIGGTGKSGKYLVNRLLAQGFPIKLLHRNPENHPIPDPHIEWIKGDARDYASILKLVRGARAVISTLGQPKGEPSIFSQATRNVICAMDECGVSRYIVTTGLNVDVPGDLKGEKTKAATQWMKTHYPETTADKQVELQLLSDSHVDWTLVRLPLIELTDASWPLHISLTDMPGDKISATDLADFLISQLSDRTYIRRAPFISNG